MNEDTLARIERAIANLGLKVDAVDHKTEAAIAEARAAHSAAVVASDTGSAIVTMLREEVMGGLADIDRKVETAIEHVDSLATFALGLQTVQHEHQRRLDALEEAESHEGNGAAE